jgi:hypothetical protein
MISNFILRTCDGTNAKLGTGSKLNNSCTWSSVDIRSIIGTLWDDHEYFNLKLKQVVCDIMPANWAQSGHGLAQQIFMTGLNWENCNFDVSRNISESKSCIGYVNHYGVGTTTGVIYNCSESMCNTFRKGCPIVDINITLYSILTGYGDTGVGDGFGQRTYFLEIEPCKNYDNTCATMLLRSAFNTSTADSGATRFFNNINLKNLLGNMYLHYKRFNIEILHLQSTAYTATITNNGYGANLIMYGFPFENIYNASTGKISNFANVCHLDLSDSAGTTKYIDTNIDQIVIVNPPEIINIKLQFISAYDGNICTNSGTFNHIDFLFKITPLID